MALTDSTHQRGPHGEEVGEECGETGGETVLGEDGHTQLGGADDAVAVLPVPVPARNVQQVTL